MPFIRHLRAPARRTLGTAALTMAALALAALAGACSNLLEVTNPNQLKEEDLRDATSAPALANGALAMVASGVSQALLPQSAISDELKWVGSYDSGRDLYSGNNIGNPRNEFTMSAFPALAQGRWTSDNAIALLTAFDKSGELAKYASRTDLARAYVYGAVAYVAVGDMFDDFTLSDRRTPAPPLGNTGMLGLYDTAIGYLDQAIAIARARNDAALETTALALRTRARHAKAVRALLTPKGTTPANPLVNDAGAVADAQAFLARTSDMAWRYRFQYSATSTSNQLGAWINERREFRISDSYGLKDDTDKQVTGASLNDPITGTTDPVLAASINEFRAARQYGPLTVVSAREIRLILAEAALAAGNTAGAVAQINVVRAADNLPAYDPAVQTSLTPLAMLKHERRVNLFLQGRRLLDMYRFGDRSPTWLSTGEAVQKPGQLLPIADIERNANCFINGSTPCP